MSPWLGTAVALVFTACGAHESVSATAPPPIISDGLVEVGGGISLHVHCEGTGTPPVLFDSDIDDDGGAWRRVPVDVGGFTRACVYDRAGTGYSTPAPPHHTSGQMIRELRVLLRVAAIQGPYVLVGHGFGGLNVRLFASMYPSEVVGMVQVDGRLEDSAPPVFKSRSEMDLSAFRESLVEVRSVNRPLGDLPVLIVSPDKEAAEQTSLIQLSTNSVQLRSEKSSHILQRDDRKLVTAAVREAVEAARAHRTVRREVP